MELGKLLASELEDWDLLGRWMAHYVGELIATAESLDGAEAELARGRAAQEILNVWAHRSALRSPYPLESFDRVFAALDRLDLSSPPSRLSRYFGAGAPTQSELTVTPYLEVAARIDDEISDVVALLIFAAAAVAEKSEARWLPIAEQISEEESARALRRLMSVAHRRRLATLTTDVGDREVEPAGVAEDDDDELFVDTLEPLLGAPDRSPDEIAQSPVDAVIQQPLLTAVDLSIATLLRLKAGLVAGGPSRQ